MADPRSRWYKKQVLERSERALRAAMERQGHQFHAKGSKRASRAADAVRLTRVALYQGEQSGLTDRVTANRAVLRRLGFLEVGEGLMKLAHAIWRLEGDQGDVTVHRLQDEDVEAAAWTARKSASREEAYEYFGAHLSQDLSTLGYPLAVQLETTRHNAINACIRRLAYKAPESLVIRGLPVRVLGHTDTNFIVEFKGSGIVSNQPIRACLDPTRNASVTALQESAEALIARGECGLSQQARIRNEASIDETLTPEDVAEFVAAFDSAIEASIEERMADNAVRASSEHGVKSAQADSDLDDVLVCDAIDELDEDVLVELSEKLGWDQSGWDEDDYSMKVNDLREELKMEIQQDQEKLKIAAEFLDADFGPFTVTARTAQSVREWTPFNGVEVCDFSPVIHAALDPSEQEVTWKLYHKGRVHDAGKAATIEEAKDDCTQAAASLV